MGGRELIILLLGLAIVAVVLRGLYVAIQGRRGQIRMAIDKNIPQDIDLDSLELAELPGGGARVIDRSLQEVNRQNSALEAAQARAAAFDLGETSDEDEHIPVLMDAVELREVKPDNSQADSIDEYQEEYSAPAVSEEASVEEDYDSGLDAEDFSSDSITAPSIGESYLDEEIEESVQHDDPDSVLFDYGESEELEDNGDVESEQEVSAQELDPLRAVAPDYEQEPVQAEDEQQLPDYDEEDEVQIADDTHDAEAVALDEENYEEYEDESEAEEEPEQALFDPIDELDDFSLTAGERIGGSPRAAAEQSSLFDEQVEEAPAEPVKPKRKSLFSLFERKPKPKVAEQPVAPEPEPKPEIKSVPTPEIVETAPLPFVEEEAIAEPPPIDELEQVRATAKPEPIHEPTGPSEVIVLNVMARKGRVFAGDDLLHLLITSGMKFGDMNIFHKRLSNESQGAVVFSVANILNPGTFDLNKMEEFTTLGISLFLALPSPINNLDAFEQMLDVAQQIRDALDGELKDDHRNGMTAQTIEHYRQRIRDFELLRLKTAGARA